MSATPRITLAMLKGACHEQRSIFRSEWPKGGHATLENVQRAQAIGLNLDWGTRWFTAAAKTEYERVRAAAKAEFQRVRAAAQIEWLEYEHVRDAEWLEYEHVRDAVRAEFDRVTIDAQIEYGRVMAASWLAAFHASQPQAVQR